MLFLKSAGMFTFCVSNTADSSFINLWLSGPGRDVLIVGADGSLGKYGVVEAARASLETGLAWKRVAVSSPRRVTPAMRTILRAGGLVPMTC